MYSSQCFDDHLVTYQSDKWNFSLRLRDTLRWLNLLKWENLAKNSKNWPKSAILAEYLTIFHLKNPNIYQKWVFVKVLSLSDPIDLLPAVIRLEKADNFLKWCWKKKSSTTSGAARSTSSRRNCTRLLRRWCDHWSSTGQKTLSSISSRSSNAQKVGDLDALAKAGFESWSPLLWAFLNWLL